MTGNRPGSLPEEEARPLSIGDPAWHAGRCLVPPLPRSTALPHRSLSLGEELKISSSLKAWLWGAEGALVLVCCSGAGVPGVCPVLRLGVRQVSSPQGLKRTSSHVLRAGFVHPCSKLILFLPQ